MGILRDPAQRQELIAEAARFICTVEGIGMTRLKWRVQDADLEARKPTELDGGCSACPSPAMVVLRFGVVSVRVCGSCWRQLRMAVAVAVPNS
jgi:hypothetical protein